MTACKSVPFCRARIRAPVVIITASIGQDKFVLVSYETLMLHREMHLRQCFRLLGLDEDSYDYDRRGTVQMDWFKVDLELKDGNEKYIGESR